MSSVSSALIELQTCADILCAVPRGCVEPVSLRISPEASSLGRLINPQTVVPADVKVRALPGVVRRGRTVLCTLEVPDPLEGTDDEAQGMSTRALANHVHAMASFSLHADAVVSQALDCDVCVVGTHVTVSVVVPDDAPVSSHVTLNSVRVAGYLLRDLVDARFTVIVGLQAPLTLRSNVNPVGIITPAVTPRGCVQLVDLLHPLT